MCKLVIVALAVFKQPSVLTYLVQLMLKCDYKTAFSLEIFSSNFQAFTFCNDRRVLQTFYSFSRITFRSRHSRQQWSKPSHNVLHVLTDVPALVTFLTHSTGLFHQAAYYGVDCRMRSVTPNFARVVNPNPSWVSRPLR